MSKMLLIIDCQYDFINGSLAVNGAEETMDKLAVYIRENASNYNSIIATADWHPHTHCSFKENGGIWPSHCVQHTKGAAIYQPIIDALNSSKTNYSIVTKGLDEDHEEYSIFKNTDSLTAILGACTAFDITEITVVGIAYDYCVADSVKDGLRALPKINFKVLREFCPHIANDTADKFTSFINNTERVCLE